MFARFTHLFTPSNRGVCGPRHEQLRALHLRGGETAGAGQLHQSWAAFLLCFGARNRLGRQAGQAAGCSAPPRQPAAAAAEAMEGNGQNVSGMRARGEFSITSGKRRPFCLRYVSNGGQWPLNVPVVGSGRGRVNCRTQSGANTPLHGRRKRTLNREGTRVNRLIVISARVRCRSLFVRVLIKHCRHGASCSSSG